VNIPIGYPLLLWNLHTWILSETLPGVQGESGRGGVEDVARRVRLLCTGVFLRAL